MTQPSSDKLAEFFTFGCGPMSLMRIAAKHGNTITVDSFLDRFGKCFPQGQCGLTSIDTLEALAVAMGIATKTQRLEDYNVVAAEHATAIGVVVCTKKLPKDWNKVDDVEVHFHAMVLESIDASQFVLWTAYQDGTDRVLAPLPRYLWAVFETEAIVLR